MADQPCPDCSGTGTRAVRLGGDAGTLVRPCRGCRGTGRAAAPEPAAPRSAFLVPLIVLGVGLAVTGVAIALSFPLRNQPGFEWVMLGAVAGLALALVGANLSFKQFVYRYGHLKVPTWAGLAVLLALLGLFLLFVLTR